MGNSKVATKTAKRTGEIKRSIAVVVSLAFFLTSLPLGYMSTPVVWAHDGVVHDPVPTVPTVPAGGGADAPIPPLPNPNVPMDGHDQDHEEPAPCTVHCSDPKPIQDEHHAVMELVRDAVITHTAVQNGLWSDANTWADGRIPDANARIKIAQGIEVKLDFVNETPIERLRIDGKLTFATDVDTGIVVNTLVIMPTGDMEVGTEENPVQATVEAKIIIAGQILAEDKHQLGLGILNHGRITMWGTQKTGETTLLHTPKAGDRQLEFVEVPSDWSEGDVLIIAGTYRWSDTDEQVVISSIEGNKVTVIGLDEEGNLAENWRGLKWNHTAHFPADMTNFVINVTRNVTVETSIDHIGVVDEYGIARERGHWMNMHSAVAKTKIGYVGIYGLGRTDKRTPLESAELDEDGNFVTVEMPDGEDPVVFNGFNQVGRYALHFHRGGPTNAPAIITGIAIVDSPGLGLVNHSSNVIVTDAVAYNVVGSAFFTEAGDETGAFINCTAVRLTGSGQGIESRSMMAGPRNPVDTDDFGHSGHGFWLQGGGVDIINAKVAGAASSAIIAFTEALDEPGLGHAQFDAKTLENLLIVRAMRDFPALEDLSHLGEEARLAREAEYQEAHEALIADAKAKAALITRGRLKIGVDEVPLFISGATVISSSLGVQTRFHRLSSNVFEMPSIIEDIKIVGAMNIDYTNNLIIRDSTLMGQDYNWGTGISRNDVTRNITYQDLTVTGFQVGINLPQNGRNIVRGGTYQNVMDLYVTTQKDPERTIDIEGDIHFLDVPNIENYRTGRKYEIYLHTNYNPKDSNITTLFSRSIIRLGTVRYNGKNLYFYAQAADFVPFKTGEAAAYVPAEFLDKTNQQLWDEFGLAIGDAIAPANAIIDPKIHALVGDPPKFAPKISNRNQTYTNQMSQTVRVDVFRADGTKITMTLPGPITLREGWNVITFTVTDSDGLVYKRSIMMFGDTIPPEFKPDPNMHLRINPNDLRNGFIVRGTILDNAGNRPFKRSFSGEELEKLEKKRDEDGLEYVELEFYVQDLAGNRTKVVLKLTLDPKVAPARVQVRQVLPPRTVLRTLKFLLGFRMNRKIMAPGALGLVAAR